MNVSSNFLNVINTSNHNTQSIPIDIENPTHLFIYDENNVLILSASQSLFALELREKKLTQYTHPNSTLAYPTDISTSTLTQPLTDTHTTSTPSTDANMHQKDALTLHHQVTQLQHLEHMNLAADSKTCQTRPLAPT